MSIPRSIDRMVEDQARRWEFGRDRQHDAPPRPLITISRQPGAGGRELARRAAQTLGYDLFDRELLHEIAESAHLSERLVSTLDESDRSMLTDWLATFSVERYLSAYGYLRHLTHVVGAIACHGGAVILGRGAHLILGPGKALRLHTVAPLAARVARVALRDGVDAREARRRIAALEEERAAFLRRHFHVTVEEPSAFDLVLNTEVLGMDRAVEAAVAALPAFRHHARGAGRTPEGIGAATI